MDAQGTEPLAKEDTRGLWLNYELDADLSQWATDLTISAAGPAYGNNGAYRASDTPRQLTGALGREIVVRFEVNPGSDKSACVVALGPPASSVTVAWAIELDSSTRLSFRQGASVLATVAFASISGQQEVTVSWSSRPNPDTTGASNALLSEVFVFGHTSSEFEEPVQFAHAVSTVAGTHAFMLGGYGGAGGNPWTSDVRQVRSCRIGSAWHPANELADDWLFARDAKPSTGLPLPAVHVPLTWASNIGDEGQWIGQANAGVIAAESIARRRAGWSPLVNDVYHDAQPIAPESVELAPLSWHRNAPGSDLFRLRIDYLRWVPVPRGCTHAWVRIHVTQWTADAGASDPVPLQLGCWAMNRPFAVGPVGGDSFAWSRCTHSLLLENEHYEAGTGMWLDMGLVQMPVYTGPHQGWRDTVHLALGWAWDPEGIYPGDVEQGRMRIGAWHVRPLYKPIGGSLGDP